LPVGGVWHFNPSARSTVLSGTGEGDWWSWLGVGVVLRSTDCGNQWSTSVPGRLFRRRRLSTESWWIRPIRSGSMQGIARKGLWVTTDGGRNLDPGTGRTAAGRGRSAYAPDEGPEGRMQGRACSAPRTQRPTLGKRSGRFPGTPGKLPAPRLSALGRRSDAGRRAYAWGASTTTGFLWPPRRSEPLERSVRVAPGSPISGRPGTTGTSRVCTRSGRTRSIAGRNDLHRGDALGAPLWTWVKPREQSPAGANSNTPGLSTRSPSRPARPGTVSRG
jgi:hypothetical protein